MVADRIGLFIGGSWHDFDGFAQQLADTLGDAAARLERCELGALAQLDELGCSAAILYTCLDEHTTLSHDARQLAGLCNWVRGGGGLLALHASTVAAQTHPELAALLGGHFESHPPQTRFLVHPKHAGGWLTRGIGEFEIDDERYELAVRADVDVQLVAHADGRELALGWSREEGAGRVFYLSLGHDVSTWSNLAYRTLLRRALAWVEGSDHVD